MVVIAITTAIQVSMVARRVNQGVAPKKMQQSQSHSHTVERQQD
jgi:hypothetical protein